ncbi:MAG TPA: SRPBCC family protein [Bacteroidia bacterium]|nr:SRPBCC family protein [Bacteroidia bacterium]
MEKIRKTITVQTTVKAPVEKVWKYWAGPEHIVQWSSGHPDWHTPKAQNDLRVGGQFSSRMEAKDGSMGFDFGGTYTDVKLHERIAYKMGDERKVQTQFTSNDRETNIIQTFEMEDQNPEEIQRGGWQTILDNFKKYTESN